MNRSMLEAIEMIPDGEKSAFLKAQQCAPDLVATESDPERFLRFENDNPWSAARRLIEYWKLRSQVFKERAFLPLDFTGEGAFSEEDIAFIQMGSGVVLPSDNQGRPVGFVDRSRIKTVQPEDTHWDQLTIRNAFLLMHRLSENPQSQTKGAVIVTCPQYNNNAHYQKIFREFFEKCLEKAFPVKLKALHLVAIIPSDLKRHFFQVFLPTITRRCGGSFLREKIVVHVSQSAEGLLPFLQAHGLKAEGLPETLGGKWSYSEFDAWFNTKKGGNGPSNSNIAIRPEPSSDALNSLPAHDSAREMIRTSDVPQREAGGQPPANNSILGKRHREEPHESSADLWHRGDVATAPSALYPLPSPHLQQTRQTQGRASTFSAQDGALCTELEIFGRFQPDKLDALIRVRPDLLTLLRRWEDIRNGS